ncbi:hypothetical protein LCGC14_2309930, partial [marine sediment metagenome]
EVNDYETICNKFGNGTISSCGQRLIGTHLEDKEIWKDLDRNSFVEGEVLNIGIFTDVKIDDEVEWIPTFYGIRIDEWAIWTSNLNVDIVSFYKLNETSGSAIDSLGLMNSTTVQSGVVQGVEGLINNSYNFTSVSSRVDFNSNQQQTNSNQTYSIWFNPGNTAPNTAIFVRGDAGEDNYDAIAYDDGFIRFFIGPQSGSSSRWNATSTKDVMLPNGTWYNIVVNTSGSATASSTNIFINGVLQTTSFTTAGSNRSRPSDSVSLFLGGGIPETGNINVTNGRIDEVGIWNRSLTTDEINNLYNGGSGISFTDIFNINVTLDSPINDSDFLTNSINFSATLNDSENPLNILVNSTLEVWHNNGTRFSIDTINITGNFNVSNFSKTIPIGDDYLWNVIATDNNSRTGTAENNFTFSIKEFFIETSITFNASTFETASETFTSNITTNGTAPVSASLIYNGTEFTGATITNPAGDNFSISRTIDIPLINGDNTPFHFNFSIEGTELATDDSDQSVNLTTFEFCETGQQPAYINFTFTNETVAEEAITAEIDTNWNFWLGSGTVVDSLTFSNTTENPN